LTREHFKEVVKLPACTKASKKTLSQLKNLIVENVEERKGTVCLVADIRKCNLAYCTGDEIQETLRATDADSTSKQREHIAMPFNLMFYRVFPQVYWSYHSEFP
jgi:hypothetical protein